MPKCVAPLGSLPSTCALDRATVGLGENGGWNRQKKETDPKGDFLGGGFKHLLFSPLFGEDFQFDKYFSDGLKPPTSDFLCFFFGGDLG